MKEGEFIKRAVTNLDLWRKYAYVLPEKDAKLRFVPEEVLDEAFKEFLKCGDDQGLLRDCIWKWFGDQK